jgi:phosphatidylglycerophosphatase A
MTLLNRLFATLFGIGRFPGAPGTAASAAAVLLYVLVLHPWPWPFYLLFLGVLFLLGTATSYAYAAEVGQADPKRVVIDEAFGQLLALFLVPVGWLPLTAAFLLFRFFDIIKPFPIRKLERLPGGWGIMADDAAAGAAAGIIVHLIMRLV